MKIMDKLIDFYYVNLKGLHKHDFEHAGRGENGAGSWPIYECSLCKDTLWLTPGEMKDLPVEMKYKKIPNEEMNRLVSEMERRNLKKDLDRAIKVEDYETAAEIWNKLK